MLAVNWMRVQERLRDAGFDPGPIDGIRGPQTDDAIVEFKGSVGLRRRRLFGPLTHAALFADEGVKKPKKQKTGTAADYPYIAIARNMLGVHERRNYARLRQFLLATARLDWRRVAWCGAFVDTCMKMAGYRTTVANPLGARNWQNFGKRVTPQLGAILVFWRGSKAGWKGHVGFYWGEDEHFYYVLGGNQSNAVTIAKIPKYRLICAVMPSDVTPLNKTVRMSRGGPVSTNEA